MDHLSLRIDLAGGRARRDSRIGGCAEAVFDSWRHGARCNGCGCGRGGCTLASGAASGLAWRAASCAAPAQDSARNVESLRLQPHSPVQGDAAVQLVWHQVGARHWCWQLRRRAAGSAERCRSTKHPRSSHSAAVVVSAVCVCCARVPLYLSSGFGDTLWATAASVES